MQLENTIDLILFLSEANSPSNVGRKNRLQNGEMLASRCEKYHSVIYRHTHCNGFCRGNVFALGSKDSFMGGAMKITIYCSLFVLLALMSFPITADAFSRRSHHSDFSQSQAVTAPLQTADVSPNAVPEPPVLLLMSIGIGLLALCVGVRRFRGQAASDKKAP